jgi:hypothetical protein
LANRSGLVKGSVIRYDEGSDQHPDDRQPGMRMKRLYLDTNVFLQFRYQEIDWCELVKADEVTLVVVAEVLREIEKQKDQGRGALQKRARTAASWLGKIVEAEDGVVRPGVRLATALRDPTNQQVEALGMSPDAGDDRILAAILRDAEAGGHEGVFVTDDTLRRLKARDHALAVVAPPDDKKLADEPDPLDVENRKLRQEIDTRPKLALAFKDRATHVAVRLLVPVESVDEQLETIVEEERDMIDGVMAHAFGDMLHDPPSKAETSRYLDKYREWVRQHYDELVRSRLTFTVELALSNDGRGVAKGIDVSLTLPETLFPAQPSPVEIPLPPKRPEWRSRLAALESFKLPSVPDYGLGAVAETFSMQERDGVLEHDEAHPHLAKFHLRSLKHGLVFPLTVPLWFADVDTARAATGFAIGYSLHADNLPDIRTGKLDVKLDVAEIPLSAHHIKRRESKSRR